MLARVWTRTWENDLSTVAAGIAFWSMLALFPAIAALVSIYGFFSDPADIAANLAAMRPFLPPEVYDPVDAQLRAVARADTGALGLASLFSLAVALWSARNGVSAMMTGLNVVYSERDTRGFLASTAVTLVLTLTLICVGVIALIALVVVPTLVALLPLGPLAEWTARLVRWPILAAAAIGGIGLLYRFGPHRRDAKARWISWGASVAVLLWLLASVCSRTTSRTSPTTTPPTARSAPSSCC